MDFQISVNKTIPHSVCDIRFKPLFNYFYIFSLEDMQFYPSSVGMLLLFILDLDFSR